MPGFELELLYKQTHTDMTMGYKQFNAIFFLLKSPWYSIVTCYSVLYYSGFNSITNYYEAETPTIAEQLIRQYENS